MTARWAVTSIVTRFILVETQHGGNVGSAARAMKTMGFADLALVRPTDAKVVGRSKTERMASGALDVLQSAQIYPTLEEAAHGFDLCCGTGMPHDMFRQRRPRDYRAPRPYFASIMAHHDGTGSNGNNNSECGNIQHDLGDGGNATFGSQDDALKIAFVFGNERMGMNEEDMDLCDVMLGIPTNPKFGSLNLASAVQLVAYDWREAIDGYRVGDL